MAILYPGAAYRPLGPQTQARMATYDVICLHTMVGSLSGTDAYFKQNGYGGTESHFGIGGSGTNYQWQDLAYRADANYRGGHRVISIETADIGPEFTKWDTRQGSAVPAWTGAQLNEIAQTCAWLSKRFGIPLNLIPDSKPGRRGIGYHRQGVPNRAGATVSQTGGELWSTAVGKVCPGDRRIAQIPTIMAMANRLLNPVAPDPLPVVNGRRVLWNKSPEDLFEGRDVLSIQQWANPRFSYAKLDEDGLFGNDCERFAKEFQARVKLASDGVIGAQTYAQMEKLGFR